MEGRIPPHNLEAEASVLGSVLLDSEVLDRLEGILTAESFYKEGHRKIWTCMEQLRMRGEPVDLVTLSNELATRGELDVAGGLSYLVGLSENTPTAAYAEYYARIVAEKWTLRRLIEAAGEAMKMAYEESGSLEEILDGAGRRVLEVALAGSKTEFQNMRDLVHETFEHIQQLYENQGATTGLRSGFRELDLMIGGFTPGSLNIIAARPSMGKTAFALTIAQNVALRENIGVAIFSLEMPAVQLVTRMMCSEARIDMNRLRQGQLTDRDFSRLVDVAGRIAEAPILIDDSSDMTLMELRSRARRLMSQQKLGLIVIDYLQLMSGPTSSRNGGGENRQQEIAAISRGLKGLARELSVPVIALSQLSRAVEARPNKRPMLSDLRESGCLTGDTLVQLADGSRQPIRELVGKSGFAVLALDETTQRLEPARVSRAFSTGVKPVFALTTRLGRRIRATANHQFLTPQGWKRLDQLAVGDYLALPRKLASSQGQRLRDEELALLLHLGINSRLKRLPQKGKGRDQFHVIVSGRSSLLRFAREVGAVGSYKRQALSQVEAYLEARPENTNRDVIPLELWLHPARADLAVSGLSHRELHRALGTAYSGTTLFKQNLSRERTLRMAKALGSQALERIASSDIYWDKVVSVEAAGEEEVFDLTVPGPHNFVANNIIVHNSIEQDADLVMFIYRDDYYNPHSEKAGIAEIIVGKQRNGPTGTAELQFHAQHVRFNDLARDEV